jgi:cell division septation protein DedD
MKWMPRVRGQTVIWKNYPEDGDWICIESHIELNDHGSGGDAVANGTEEFWISDDLGANNVLESSPVNPAPGNQNMRGTYSQYGINQIAFDNNWNSGPLTPVEIYRDNIVISKERIYCEVDKIGEAPGPTPTATPTNIPPTATPTATPTDAPPTPTATPTTDPSDPTGVLG